MVYIKKEFKFEAAHRLLGHRGLCINQHGHHYSVWIYARSKNDQLNDLGMVIDFSDLKKGIGQWLDNNWDHSFIWNEKDIRYERLYGIDGDLKNDKNFKLPGNPTAENMALYLLNVCEKLYENSTINIFKIEIFETDTSAAIVEK